jgi:type IV pilus assembly protein PilN
MLVDINLLPKKEPKNMAFLVIIFAAFFILLITGAVFLWQGSRMNDQLARLDQEIRSTQKQAEAEQAKLDQNSAGTASLSQLEAAVKWANDEPIKSEPVLKRVIALLPERGFIQTINYAETGTLSLTVQFDTSREAAYFYKSLLDAKWVSGAKLSSLSTAEPKQDKANGDSAQMEDESLVPRYIGQYEVTLNRDFINSQELAEKNEEKDAGGDES